MGANNTITKASSFSSGVPHEFFKLEILVHIQHTQDSKYNYHTEAGVRGAHRHVEVVDQG